VVRVCKFACETNVAQPVCFQVVWSECQPMTKMAHAVTGESVRHTFRRSQTTDSGAGVAVEEPSSRSIMRHTCVT
jgi:hypothetical protein